MFTDIINLDFSVWSAGHCWCHVCGEEIKAVLYFGSDTVSFFSCIQYLCTFCWSCFRCLRWLGVFHDQSQLSEQYLFKFISWESWLFSNYRMYKDYLYHLDYNLCLHDAVYFRPDKMYWKGPYRFGKWSRVSGEVDHISYALPYVLLDSHFSFYF